MLSIFSTSALADRIDEPPSTKYTVPPGYKYFTLYCTDFSSVDAISYILSYDKKLISGIDTDGDAFSYVNTSCKIRTFK